jgi:anthranilate phosphoribosyltransferase
VDTCGTGGAPKTFNVSTAAGIVAAAAGAKVAKHGNRSRTGRGSAEVLRALGVQVDADRGTQAACLDQLGICFCFAVHHHPATKNVMPVRAALGIPTLFNLLGPLTNPVGAKRQVLGVYDARYLKPIAGALQALGASKAIVMHSDDGLDELSISAATELVHVSSAGLRTERITPEELGLKRAPREAVVARDLEHAAQLVRDVLSGSERGAPRDMTLMSAAAALYVADKVPSLRAGVELAAQTIDQGKAGATLERWAKRSQGGGA